MRPLEHNKATFGSVLIRGWLVQIRGSPLQPPLSPLLTTLTVQILLQLECDGQEVDSSLPLAQERLPQVLTDPPRLGGGDRLPQDHVPPISTPSPQVKGGEHKLRGKGEGLGCVVRSRVGVAYCAGVVGGERVRDAAGF